MKLLAIETSSVACSVALNIDGNISSVHQITPKQQSQKILACIQELLTSAQLSLEQLNGIVYGCGPGSFTGIRIASSVAQGLAFGANLPVYPISSLAGLAQTAYQSEGQTDMLVAVDARVGQIYWAAYSVNNSGVVSCAVNDQIGTPNSIELPNISINWCGVGDAWELYQEQLTGKLGFFPHNVYPHCLATAHAILTLAEHRIQQGEKGVNANEAYPVYLR